MHVTTGPTNSPLLGVAFINPVRSYALQSDAVNHPYLQALRAGQLPNMEMALKDFAFQYGLYSTNFIHYISAVIAQLSNAKHKGILLDNIAEEQGDTHDIELPDEVMASVVGQPHARLFRRFQEALGVDTHDSATPECPGYSWSQQFLQLCKKSEHTGIGAIGIGTELIVSRIYDQILEGLRTYSNLTMTQRVFFDLHSQCDEKHADEMLSIAEELADNRSACAEIGHGVDAAIAMRTKFWDEMLVRARGFPSSSSVS